MITDVRAGDQGLRDRMVECLEAQWEPFRRTARTGEAFQEDLTAWVQRLGQAVAMPWMEPEGGRGSGPDGHGGHGIGDPVLGIGSARVMPEVAEAMAWGGAAGALDQAADTLAHLGHVAVDGETVRRAGEPVGTMTEAREPAALDAGASEPIPDRGPDGRVALIVETDGTPVNFQDADPGSTRSSAGRRSPWIRLKSNGRRLTSVSGSSRARRVGRGLPPTRGRSGGSVAPVGASPSSGMGRLGFGARDPPI